MTNISLLRKVGYKKSTSNIRLLETLAPHRGLCLTMKEDTYLIESNSDAGMSRGLREARLSGFLVLNITKGSWIDPLDTEIYI